MAAQQAMRRPLRRVLGFGVITNLLILAPTGYMLQVYDRVLNSRSSMTLLMLTLLVLGAYLLLQLLDWVRTTLLAYAAAQFDAVLAPSLFDATFRTQLQPMGRADALLSDLATVRQFIASAALLALLDAPFALLFILLIFAIDPTLGSVALAGATLLLILGGFTERGTRHPLEEANRQAREAQRHANGLLRNAEVVAAMGMRPALYQRWQVPQQQLLQQQAIASDRAGIGSAGSKWIQTLQGSLLLGVGCWLTLSGDLDPNGAMMIVASVLGGRALAPLAQLIGQWRQLVQARAAWQRLHTFLAQWPQPQPAMPLPPPRGLLQVDNLSAHAPGSQLPLLRGVQCRVEPGQLLAVLGASGAGKSTLARLLVGLWPAASGKVRLDGVDIHRWQKGELGPHIGYLTQAVELFDGTLAENVARFGEVDPDRLAAAAALAGLEPLLRTLPQGWETPIGVDGAILSGGQRQRVGLARAYYGAPKLLVLDEPNASLDEAGEQQLSVALQQLKAAGSTLVVVTHRRALLEICDQLLILREGQMQIGGARDEVLARLRQAVAEGRG